MAFFYAWLIFYTGWLLIPGIPGIALFIYQMYLLAVNRDYIQNGDSQNSSNSTTPVPPNSEETLTLPERAGVILFTPYNFYYAIFLAIWATIMMEVWKRRESELAHLW